MKNPGPPLEALIDRLIAIPGEFFIFADDPHDSATGICLPALVNDLLLDKGGTPLSDEEISDSLGGNIEQKHGKKTVKNINYSGVVSILCYIYEDGFFSGKKGESDRIKSFLLSQKLVELSNAVESADEFLKDPDRREEICRRALDALNYYPQGENEKNSADRLLTLDSVERKKILIKTVEAQIRAKEIREAMLRQEAEEAASKMSRE